MSYDSRDGLLAVCATFTGLSIIAVGLRFYARKQQKVFLMTDDWLTIPAVVSYVAAAISVFILVSYKDLGYSSDEFTPAQTAAMAETAFKLEIAFDVSSTTSLACIKLSALFFYRRIFCVNGRRGWFHWITITTIVIVILWLIIFQFLTGFQCGTSLSPYWDGQYLKYCTISFPFLYGLAISDFLLDVWILALPIPMILRLHTTKSRKLSIIGVFLLAFVGLGASIARMAEYITVELGGPLYFLYNDEELADTKALYLAMLEAGISLVAVNLPSLWLLSTSVIPESVVRSMRSMLSLSSLRNSNSATTAANRSDAPVAHKTELTDSTRPSLPSLHSSSA